MKYLNKIRLLLIRCCSRRKPVGRNISYNMNVLVSYPMLQDFGKGVAFFWGGGDISKLHPFVLLVRAAVDEGEYAAVVE